MPLYLRLRTVFKRVPYITEQYIQAEMKFTRRGMEGGVPLGRRWGSFPLENPPPASSPWNATRSRAVRPLGPRAIASHKRLLDVN